MAIYFIKFDFVEKAKGEIHILVVVSEINLNERSMPLIYLIK